MDAGTYLPCLQTQTANIWAAEDSSPVSTLLGREVSKSDTAAMWQEVDFR